MMMIPYNSIIRRLRRLLWLFLLIFNNPSLCLVQPESSRRIWLTKLGTSSASIVFPSFLPVPVVALATPVSATTDTTTDTATVSSGERISSSSSSSSSSRSIVRLLSGVQYADARVGLGPVIDNPRGRTAPTVVMHLRALLRDGSVLFDTVEDGDGSPILYRLGSSEVQDFANFFGGGAGSDSRRGARSKVVSGVEDAILARGQQGDPMREGGIRMVVVPSPLGYGNAGVSRFEAFQMGLRKPIPRNELLRYEVELLRCLDVEIPDSTGQTIQACCAEENYPCKTPSANGEVQ